MKILPIGSISSGTMRSEDLFDAFVDALAEVAPRKAQTYRKWERESLRDSADGDIATFYDECVNDLFDVLNNYVPAYCVFGSHEGDGADYGVWPCHDSIREDLRNYDLAVYYAIPKGYTGYAVDINDHGNCTLYKVSRGRSRKLWAIV